MVAVGTVTTVWDGEIAEVRAALESIPVVPILILTDSTPAIASIRRAAEAGKARIGDLRAVVDLIGKWSSAGEVLRFGRVKAHVGMVGNEGANALTNSRCSKGNPTR